MKTASGNEHGEQDETGGRLEYGVMAGAGAASATTRGDRGDRNGRDGGCDRAGQMTVNGLDWSRSG